MEYDIMYIIGLNHLVIQLIIGHNGRYYMYIIGI